MLGEDNEWFTVRLMKAVSTVNEGVYRIRSAGFHMGAHPDISGLVIDERVHREMGSSMIRLYMRNLTGELYGFR